ncbi:MAG: FG-GAP-like repeat-containing protein [Ignavibacteria bacterium]|nr:FG-GAP-like repeat-containing protein [Ignavibacteria bacterium]
MKTILILFSALLFSGFVKSGENAHKDTGGTVKLHCPDPVFAGLISTESGRVKSNGSGKDIIDEDWYGKAVQQIARDEYSISYSDDLNAYQSPNRKNNIRFIYHSNGFTAKTRSNKIPKLDAGDKSLSRDEMKYVTIEEWELKMSVDSERWGLEGKQVTASGNTASVENEKIRIQYLNNEEGMRQDFIIKQKPAGEGKLKLDVNVDTKLKVTVGADVLMFKNDKGEEKMKYTSLKVWDANGKPLRAYFEKKELSTLNSHFSILVNDADAVYPVTIDPLSTTASWTATGTQGDEHFGHTAATAGDVNGDGYSDVVIGAPEFDNSQNEGGRVYVYYGSATGLSSTANWTKDELGITAGGRFGYSVATAGDVNGDGYSDLIVGAMTFTNSPSVYGPGKAFVYHGSPSGLSAGANWGYAYTVANSGFGYSVSSAGDVNGDGYSDVIVGAPYTGINSDPGTAFVFHGGAGGLNPNPNWQYTNIFSFTYLGTSVSTAGDVNGDGYSDVIVGGPREPNGFTNAGKAIVFHGSASGLPANPNWTVLGSQVGAELGQSVSTAGDVNGDGYSDVMVGIWLFTNGNTSEGRVNVYHGSSTGLSGSANWVAESNSEDGNLGRFVSSAGDINGDGYGDIIAGAPNFSNGQSNEGKAFAWFGSSTGLGANGTPANADWSAESDLDTNYFGSCVATAGDVNGDGYSDVLVSSNTYPYDGYNKAGKVSLFTGSQSGLSTTFAWSNESNQQDALYGYSVSTAGDVNSDGYSDVIVGAYSYDNGQANEGRVYIYHGSSTGLSTTANTVSESNSASALFGYSVSTAGDVNGDGFSDVLVGGPGWAGSGRVYVFHGSLSGISTVWNYSLNADGSGYYLGCSVSTAGDVNGDGYSDVIVGAENYSNGQTEEGKAYIHYGGSTGLNTIAAWSSEINQAFAKLGHSVSTAGDINGDGYSDVIAGAIGYDNGQTNEGGVWVYYGSVSGISGSSFLEKNVTSASFGTSVASAGDVNGDGYSDVIIGADGYSNPETTEGAAFVYNGSAAGLTLTPGWSAESNQALAGMGFSVATAGDVNGDGYSDVVIGTRYYSNGQTYEGRIQVFHGSGNGLSANANTSVESNVSNANLGNSVSSAGDVNGDGYSDVIAGASNFSNGESQEGKAFVYYGGGEGGARATVQQYSPGSSSVIGSGGLTYYNGQVKLAIFARSPYGRTKAKINHEYKTNGNPFSGTVVSNSTGSTGTGVLTNLGLTGTEIFHSIDGLQTGKLYKWRARVQYDLASNPYQKLGPWKYYNAYNPLPHGNFRPSNGLTLNKVLNLTMFVEGFYNPATNNTVQDTVRVYIRNSTNPYAIIDSSKAVFSSSGQATVSFTNVTNGVNYYIQVKHRNSLETWSKTAQAFTSGLLNYDFTTAATKAFGDNMKQVDSSPVEFAVYSGDVNKDGTVDATDLSLIDNDATAFAGGYIVTDLTGDNFTDGTDYAIADNNAGNFVSVVTP